MSINEKIKRGILRLNHIEFFIFEIHRFQSDFFHDFLINWYKFLNEN